MSVYRGELTAPCLTKSIVAIKRAYPNLPTGFYEVFADRIKANGFSDDRLQDAVAYVIDNCIYPTPTIAQFISFDKKVKLNSYEDMLKKADEIGADIWNSYESILLPGRTKKVWIHVDDIKQFNIA